MGTVADAHALHLRGQLLDDLPLDCALEDRVEGGEDVVDRLVRKVRALALNRCTSSDVIASSLLSPNTGSK
jgi:hypothetical protein